MYYILDGKLQVLNMHHFRKGQYCNDRINNKSAYSYSWLLGYITPRFKRFNQRTVFKTCRRIAMYNSWMDYRNVLNRHKNKCKECTEKKCDTCRTKDEIHKKIPIGDIVNIVVEYMDHKYGELKCSICGSKNIDFLTQECDSCSYYDCNYDIEEDTCIYGHSCGENVECSECYMDNMY